MTFHMRAWSKCFCPDRQNNIQQLEGESCCPTHARKLIFISFAAHILLSLFVALVMSECNFSWQVQHLLMLDCEFLMLESHFLWQVQYLVKCKCHFWWQVQLLVKFR